MFFSYTFGDVYITNIASDEVTMKKNKRDMLGGSFGYKNQHFIFCTWFLWKTVMCIRDFLSKQSCILLSNEKEVAQI